MQIILKYTTILLLVLAAWLAAQTARVCRISPETASEEREDVPYERPVSTASLPTDAWQSFRVVAATPEEHQQIKFRLAGTFFMMPAPGQDPDLASRRAILDDAAANRQHIVSERQRLEDFDIVSIQSDKVLVRHHGREFELTLSFRTTGSSAAATTSSAASTNDLETVLETSRFGKRVGETRWVIQKQSLVDYYKELLDNPERIASIYMSMKPDRQDGKVAGYRIEQAGEQDFFGAMGLQEGDTIRRVNSMRMTSQNRAEYFIGEFMKDRLGAVVLDIERNGQPQKMIYLLR